LVGGVVGDRGAALVRRLDRAYQTELLVHAAADPDPLMAGGAAGVEEGLEAAHLRVVERAEVARDERVDRRRREQTALERTDRAPEVVVADRLLVAGERRGE